LIKKLKSNLEDEEKTTSSEEEVVCYCDVRVYPKSPFFDRG